MQMFLFTLATLSPAALLAAAGVCGGVWGGLALAYMTLFTAVLDRYVPRLLPEAPEGAEFPSGKTLSVVLGLVHLMLLPMVIWGVSRGAVGWSSVPR